MRFYTGTGLVPKLEPRLFNVHYLACLKIYLLLFVYMLLDCILVKSGTSQEGYYLASKEEVIANKDSIVQQIDEWGTASFVAGTVSNPFLCSKRIFNSLL